MTTFKATVLRGPDEIGVEELTLLPLADDLILVRVGACEYGMTDAMFTSPLLAAGTPVPQVIGHSIAGVVEQVGANVTKVKVGDRIIANGTPYCGRCWACLHDKASQCEQMRPVSPPYALTHDGLEVRGMGHVGGLSELAVITEMQAVVVGATPVSDDDLAAIAATFGTGVGSALLIAPVDPASVVAIVGLGASGLAYLQAARFRGARTIIGIDPVASRRERALELGATHVIDPASEDPVDAVAAITGGQNEGSVFGGAEGYSATGADFVFEASADVNGMVSAFRMTRPSGHVTFTSLPHDPFASVPIPAADLALFSRHAHGCQAGGILVHRDFPMMISLVENGHLSPELLHDFTGGMEDIPALKKKILAHEVVGAVIHPNA